MPGAGKKRKGKAKTNAFSGTHSDAEDVCGSHADASPPQCLTLDDDEIVRCDKPVADGDPRPNRCRVHHEQYRTLCKKYEDASAVVDAIIKDSTELPTKEQTDQYTDWHAAVEKARWVGTYLEAVRVEKTGREIHQRRFFLKADDGHKQRLQLLEREMVKAIDLLDALQGRAYQLYHSNAANGRGLSAIEVELEKESKWTAEQILKCIRDPSVFSERCRSMPRLIAPPTEVGDEDLIDISLRDTREQILMAFDPFIDFESFKDMLADILVTPPTRESGMTMMEKVFFIYQRFARRIVFHEPTLFMKSLQKTSFKDFILSDELSMEDLVRFLNLFMNPLGSPLKWFKDSVLDTLAISHHSTLASAGDLESQFPLLGGSTFNRSHTTSMSDEAWWLLLKALQPSADMDSLFVRLCNNFDDLVSFVSFAAFGLVPSPSFCPPRTDPEYPDLDPDLDADDPRLSRNHLSLFGIVVADMVGMSIPQHLRGPVPTSLRATRWNSVIWAEVEPRAYIFGAMRNERDPFVDAFLRELRARPDLFQVVLRSETAPGQRVEMFGSGTSNDEALPALRMRQFEAPRSPFPPAPPPSARNRWIVEWSARDVLYGSKREPEMKGYLSPDRDPDEQFFRFKTFPVTYFVIVDAVPYRDPTVLMRNVSWAALRAGGYAEGEYTIRKYAIAADKMLEQRAQERLGEWLPEELEPKLPRVRDRMTYCTIM